MAEVRDAQIALAIVAYAEANDLAQNTRLSFPTAIEAAESLIKQAEQAAQAGIRSREVRTTIAISQGQPDYATRRIILPNGEALTDQDLRDPDRLRAIDVYPMPQESDFIRGAARVFNEDGMAAFPTSINELRSGSTIALPEIDEETFTVDQINNDRLIFEREAQTAANLRAKAQAFGLSATPPNGRLPFNVDQTNPIPNKEPVMPQTTLTTTIDTDEVQIEVGRDDYFTGKEFIDRLESLGGEWDRSYATDGIADKAKNDPYFPGLEVKTEDRAEVVRIIELLIEIDENTDEDVEDARIRRKDSFGADDVKELLADRGEFPEEVERLERYIDWDRYASDYVDDNFNEIEIPTAYDDAGTTTTYLLEKF